MAIKRRGVTQGNPAPTVQQKVSASIEANFTGGLKTEFTGLNFPENACTDCDNCVFSIIGDAVRRNGFNYETNHSNNNISITNNALNSYYWKNVGGDGETQVYVLQSGNMLYFFLSSAATVGNPLSNQFLSSSVNISSFLAQGSSNTVNGIECQFADGNGYLFVYHPYCDPFYCTYNAGTITAKIINIQIRDVAGIVEPGVGFNFRPTTLTPEHEYNLTNQGWSVSYTATSTTSNTIGTGSKTFTINSSTLPIPIGGDITAIAQGTVSGIMASMSGTVTSYTGTTLVMGITSTTGTGTYTSWNITPTVNSLLIWFNDEANYPSNADQWWEFKDSTDVFDPTTTVANIPLDNAQAPQGSIILNAFIQDRSAASHIPGLTVVSTLLRPSNGCWFQGRVWYTGVNASQQATGDAQYYTWTENIYFSSIVQAVTDFGNCYETNDPTAETSFEELPTDGGVITIQGCGAIYRLFPIQNGLLVFAANGVWFITGSSGIGFAATDYTITKISAVQSISSTSFIDVLGLPLFWNEEGIYAVEPAKGTGYGLGVNPLTVGTILSFYNNIPLDSKKYARGSYNPLTYIVQWVYRDTEESGIANRYQYDSVLNLNIYTKAFYPYSLPEFMSNGTTQAPDIAGVTYIASPGGSSAPDPVFKYLTTTVNGVSFAEENDDTTWLDWHSFDGVGVDTPAFFITGYRLHGQALVRFQMPYLLMFSRNDISTAYKINSIWDFATGGDSGRYSGEQVITNMITNFGMVMRRHRLRGSGYSLQIQLTSMQGQPFDIMGWSAFETVNRSV